MKFPSQNRVSQTCNSRESVVGEELNFYYSNIDWPVLFFLRLFLGFFRRGIFYLEAFRARSILFSIICPLCLLTYVSIILDGPSNVSFRSSLPQRMGRQQESLAVEIFRTKLFPSLEKACTALGPPIELLLMQSCNLPVN